MSTLSDVVQDKHMEIAPAGMIQTDSDVWTRTPWLCIFKLMCNRRREKKCKQMNVCMCSGFVAIQNKRRRLIASFCSRQSSMGGCKCSCGGRRDQSRGHPMSFCCGTPGKSGGRAFEVTGGRRVSPCIGQGAGPFHCVGVKQLYVHNHWEHERRRREKGIAEIVQGPTSSLLVHPSPLETHCVWQSKLGIHPASKAAKQDRHNRNNNNQNMNQKSSEKRVSPPYEKKKQEKVRNVSIYEILIDKRLGKNDIVKWEGGLLVSSVAPAGLYCSVFKLSPLNCFIEQ